MKSGFVSIVGRPNTGKSTLLNSLIKKKVAITTNVAGTTRNVIQGIYNEKDYQIVFVDTPGVHKAFNKLGRVLNKQAFSLMREVDAVLFVVDAKSGIGEGDRFIIENLKKSECPVILVINKIDLISNKDLLSIIESYKDLMNFSEIVPVSALKDNNVKTLIDVVKKYLTDEIKYFRDDIYTSNSIKFMISEIVREKLFMETHDEIPHSITCHTVMFEEKKDLVRIGVDIIVDRENIKKMIIGKNGEKLKSVGLQSRIDIEELLNKHIYLETYVKVIETWKDKERYLKELGFIDFE